MEKSKRGRRPKVPVNVTKIENLNSDTPIIAHLPIDLSEVINEQVNEIFLKPENESNRFENHNDNYNDTEVKMLRKKIDELNIRLAKYEKNIKPSIIACDGDSKCWWDTHYFNTPPIEMPESYFNGKFNCSGKFCSWECMIAYNIDINDENISKRTSLIYMMYKKTYNSYRIINPASSWKVLIDFGGVISIEEFRENLLTNSLDYNYIKPPIISRISYIEKIQIKKDDNNDVKNDDLILKRSKPLKSSKYNLESIMGLKKIVNNV
jgi:hypothetical protein